MNKFLNNVLLIMSFLIIINSSYGTELLTTCKTFNSSDNGKHFELQNDLSSSSQCLFFLEDDISLNCNNYTILAQTPVWSFNQENITLTNCNLVSTSSSNTGIDLFQTDNSYFENITVISNNTGILLDESNSNDFVCVEVISSITGISLIDSNNNNFSCLNIKNSTIGVSLQSSQDNYFQGVIESTVSGAIKLEVDDTSITGNIFEFLIEKGSSLISGDIGEFSERFDLNQNNISNTFLVSNSVFNFNDPNNNSINEVDVEVNSSLFGNLLSQVLNSSNQIFMYVSYYEYNSTSQDVEQFNFTDFEFSISKINYSNINSTLSFQEEYNFTLFSTNNLTISLVNYTSNIFDNESKVIPFIVEDNNNYSISNVSVELNGTIQNVTYNSLNSQYSFEINASNLPLGITQFTIQAINEFNISSQLVSNINVISSLAPKLELELSQNYTLTNNTIQINISIDTNKSYNYTLSTQLNESILLNSSNGTLTLVTNYTPSLFNNINFTLYVIDEDNLNSSVSKYLVVYLDENFTFEIQGKENVTNNSITTLEITNSTQQNNISNWYEFYINNTLIQNSTNKSIEIKISDYSSNFYTTFDNITNITQTFLDVVVFIKNSIGVNSNQTYIFQILNASNITASVDYPSSIIQNRDLDIEVIYSSSLNYSFESVLVIIDNNQSNTLEFNSTTFQITGLSLGSHNLDFLICNIYDECVEIENQSVNVIRQTSSGGGSSGGGGGGRSRGSSNDDEEQSSGGLSSVVVINENPKKEVTQVVTAPFFQEVSSDEENQTLIYEVEQASLDVNENQINNPTSGQFTQNIGSMIAIIIGFIVISGIVYFALIKK